MPRFTKEQLEERYQKLPQILKDALYGPETAEKLFSIGRKNGLTIEEIGDAAEETGYVFLGLTRPQFFIDALQKRIDTEEKQIQQLAAEINHQIFFPLREALKQAHEFDVSEEAIRKGESLIAGLSKTAPPAAAPRPEPQKPAPAAPTTGRFPQPWPKPIEPAAKPPSRATPPPAPAQQAPTQKPPPGAIVPPKYVPGAPKITIQQIEPAPMNEPLAPVPAPPKPTAPYQPPKPPLPPKSMPPTQQKPVMITKPPFSKPPAPPPTQPTPLTEPPAAKPETPRPGPQLPKSEPTLPPAPSSKIPPIDLRAQAKPPLPQTPAQTPRTSPTQVAPAPLQKPAPYQNTDPYREPVE